VFCPRDLPSFGEIRELAKDIIGVESTAIFTAMRTFEVADALAGAVESNLRHQFGLSLGRFYLLMILHRYSESELTPSDLAQRAAVTRATVTGLLDGLEGEGLVERHAHSTDRRRITLKLTAAGKAFIAKLIPAFAPRLSAVASGLSESERRQFLRLLDKIQLGLETLRALGKDAVPA
jgi:DNA-binding MarR family transcriptional regulator